MCWLVNGYVLVISLLLVGYLMVISWLCDGECVGYCTVICLLFNCYSLVCYLLVRFAYGLAI